MSHVFVACRVVLVGTLAVSSNTSHATFVLDGAAAAGKAHAKRRLAAAKAERDAVFS